MRGEPRPLARWCRPPLLGLVFLVGCSRLVRPEPLPDQANESLLAALGTAEAAHEVARANWPALDPSLPPDLLLLGDGWVVQPAGSPLPGLHSREGKGCPCWVSWRIPIPTGDPADLGLNGTWRWGPVVRMPMPGLDPTGRESVEGAGDALPTVISAGQTDPTTDIAEALFWAAGGERLLSEVPERSEAVRLKEYPSPRAQLAGLEEQEAIASALKSPPDGRLGTLRRWFDARKYFELLSGNVAAEDSDELNGLDLVFVDEVEGARRHLGREASERRLARGLDWELGPLAPGPWWVTGRPRYVGAALVACLGDLDPPWSQELREPSDLRTLSVELGQRIQALRYPGRFAVPAGNAPGPWPLPGTAALGALAPKAPPVTFEDSASLVVEVHVHGHGSFGWHMLDLARPLERYSGFGYVWGAGIFCRLAGETHFSVATKTVELLVYGRQAAAILRGALPRTSGRGHLHFETPQLSIEAKEGTVETRPGHIVIDLNAEAS